MKTALKTQTKAAERNGNVFCGFVYRANGTYLYAGKHLYDDRSWGSRNLVGIAIQLCDSEEEEFLVYDSMQIRPEKFDFGVE